jgi:hypothetical protein
MKWACDFAEGWPNSSRRSPPKSTTSTELRAASVVEQALAAMKSVPRASRMRR